MHEIITVNVCSVYISVILLCQVHVECSNVPKDLYRFIVNQQAAGVPAGWQCRNCSRHSRPTTTTTPTQVDGPFVAARRRCGRGRGRQPPSEAEVVAVANVVGDDPNDESADFDASAELSRILPLFESTRQSDLDIDLAMTVEEVGSHSASLDACDDDDIADDAVAEDAIADDALADDDIAHDALTDDDIAEDALAEDAIVDDALSDDDIADDAAVGDAVADEITTMPTIQRQGEVSLNVDVVEEDDVVEPQDIAELTPFRVARGASQRGRDLLVESVGFTYNVAKKCV